MYPTPPPAVGSVLSFDVDPRFSHVTVDAGNPGKWFPKQFTFLFVGWARVVQSVDGDGVRAGVEMLVLVDSSLVPASRLPAVLGFGRATITGIFPAQVTHSG